jgi:type IV pilus assembly protein PilC
VSDIGVEQLEDSGLYEFAYEAVSLTSGAQTSSTMTAPSEQAVAVALQESGWFPVSIERVSTSRWSMDVNQLLKRPPKLKGRELAYLTARTQRLLSAGVSIPAAFLSLSEDAPETLSKVYTDISTQVSSGVPLSDALGRHPSVFNRVYVSYVAAGESSGQLALSMGRLASMLDKQAKIAGKVKSVMTYPALISGAIGLIVVGLIRFLVPRFAEIYDDFGAELPGPTRVAVRFSELMSPITTLSIGPVPVPVPELRSPTLWALVLFFILRRFFASRRDDLEFGRRFDRIRFRLPIFGQLFRMISMSRWASTLAGGLAAGVKMTDAVLLAAEASGSRWQKLVARDLAAAVQEGRPLSSEMRRHPDLFPIEVRTMLETGEQTGAMDSMLETVSDAMDAEIEVVTETMSAKIEVALLITMGVVVGGLLLVVYMPILNLTGAMMSSVGG